MFSFKLLPPPNNSKHDKPERNGVSGSWGHFNAPETPFRSGFTLIELLVVIAIIAILSVVVILTLNPAELLRQSRDSNRLSDLSTMNSALGIYAAQGGTGFGSSSIVYVSIPDPTATSTSGDQCQGLGLPTAPSGTSYFCEASSSYRNVNGTGWIPINFSTLSAGSPLGSLPQDPTNTTTTGNYYTYATNGTQFIVTAIPESVKTKSNLAINPQIPDYPEVMAQGSNLTISPLWSPTGLVGYWNFEEGSGTTALDQSGNQNNGTWSGSLINGTHYAGGKVGSYAGNFDGSADYIDVQNRSAFAFSTSTNFSSCAWFYPLSANTGGVVNYGTIFTNGTYNEFDQGVFYIDAVDSNGTASEFGVPYSLNAWNDVCFVVNKNNSTLSLYQNGVLGAFQGVTFNGSFNGSAVDLLIGKLTGYNTFYGQIDDVRIYNRALSASEIQALYNAEK